MRAIRKDSLYPQIAAELRQRIQTGVLTGALPGVQKLAGEFGVNFMTVDKALNQLAAEGLVHRLPRQGTFVRNRRAIAFAMRRPDETIRNRAIFLELLGAVQRELSERFCLLVLFDLDRADSVQAEMLARRVDGLITLGADAEQELPEPLQQLPRINALGIPRLPPQHDQVTCDNIRIGELGASYLQRCGCRQVIAVCPADWAVAEARCNAFLRHTARLGMTARLYQGNTPSLAAQRTYETQAAPLAAWRRDGFPATGIFAVNDRLAAVATQELLLHGQTPNRDVFVVGCNLPAASSLPAAYDFAHIDLGMPAIAAALLDRLFQRIATPELPPQVQILPPSIIRNPAS